MFALWMALALFSSLFLFVWYGGSFGKSFRNKLAITGNLFFYVIISWCLICSTSRSGIISYWVGTIMMTLMILCTDRGAALGCLHIARRLCGEKIPLLNIR